MNIVFDFGAVLFTWKPGHLLLQSFPERLPTPQDAANLAHQIFSHADWHAFDAGLLDADEVISRTARRLDLPQQRLGALVHGIGERLTPIDGTVTLLQQLHARRAAAQGVTGLYYLSNMPISYARCLEQRHAFLQCFDGGIFSGDVKLIKPAPDIYHMLQSRYALDPATTLFVDDLKHNVETARALGWHGIVFESAAQLQSEMALLGL
jgi:putative hydrolase of the HAD superfamily